ncbi:MAG TPA: PEP-CTERM sorting domain-containing protein [Chthoniobacteraceae bacterium]|nr:PEP-CTERM sorting domain-containing protein [Chthoniobacteraceae bacterium]
MIRRLTSHSAIITLLAISAFAVTAHAQTTWTFTGSTNNDFQTPTNWDQGTVPILNGTATGTPGTAVINNGDAVTYNPGGDFILNNGGTLEITNGSWTQINGGAWIQLGETTQGVTGNGHILVNGGTFNQGTDSNNPFNLNGTGNTFTITSGSANFTTGFTNISNGLTFNIQGGSVVNSTSSGTVAIPLTVQSGAVVNVSGGSLTYDGNLVINGGTWNQSGGIVTMTGSLNELDYETASSGIMSGGTLNIPSLITGVNSVSGTSNTFLFSGGVINDYENSNNGYYGSGSAHAFNFTAGSTGVFNFSGTNDTLSQVVGFVSDGGFEDNGVVDTTGTTLFSVSQSGTVISVELASAIPEPSSSKYAVLGFGGLGLWVFLRRKKARIAS